MRCQHRIFGIKWSDFIRNVDVRAASVQESLESVVCMRRLRLFGHVARMPDTVPAKAILTLACEVREGSQEETTRVSPTTWFRQSYQRLLSHSNRSFEIGDRPFKMEITRYGHLGYTSLMMLMMTMICNASLTEGSLPVTQQHAVVFPR